MEPGALVDPAPRHSPGSAATHGANFPGGIFLFWTLTFDEGPILGFGKM